MPADEIQYNQLHYPRMLTDTYQLKVYCILQVVEENSKSYNFLKHISMYSVVVLQ